ncbi:MAG: hypothetical protein WCT54_02520 [Patescibacteria group bacterium]|jgi:hypothetical protein
MNIKRIFAILALAAVIGTGFFGICAIQHTPMHLDGMGGDLMSDYSFSNGQCPLADIFDYKTLNKYSSVDPTVFWRSITPSAEQHLTVIRFTNFSGSEEMIRQTPSEQGRSAPNLSVSITSPPLKEAYSKGILNPKKPLSA